MEFNKDDNRPILVQFENGSLKDESKARIQFKYMRSNLEKSNKRMLIADSGNLTYVGNILHNKQSLVRYYVGLVDRRTNRIEDIQGVQLCTLKPKLKEEVSMKETPKAEKTYRQKTDTLVEAFGSAKQKKLVSSRKKNETIHESIGEKVANVAKKIMMESPKTPDLDDSNETDLQQIIPPMDLDAKKPSNVFCIDDIISFQQYQFLKEQSQEMITFNNDMIQSWKKENKYPEFILHHLSQLPMSTEAREERGCYICYLNYLIIFSRITYKEVNRKDPCPAIPNELLATILDRFTQSENGKNRCIPRKYKDKILCYILVLALIIEGYELNCNLLIKDLKIGISKLSKLLRAMGCVVRTSNSKRKVGEETGPVERTIRAILTISPGQKQSVDTANVKKEPVMNGTEDLIKQHTMNGVTDIKTVNPLKSIAAIKKENLPKSIADIEKENLPKSIADIKKEIEE